MARRSGRHSATLGPSPFRSPRTAAQGRGDVRVFLDSTRVESQKNNNKKRTREKKVPRRFFFPPPPPPPRPLVLSLFISEMRVIVFHVPLQSAAIGALPIAQQRRRSSWASSLNLDLTWLQPVPQLALAWRPLSFLLLSFFLFNRVFRWVATG